MEEKALIKANELRIGNMVMSNVTYETFFVSAKDIVGLGEMPDMLSPIPITEEVLLGFGFSMLLGRTWVLRIKATLAEHESIEITANSDKVGYWYMGFRQGDETHRGKWHLNEYVFLKRDLQFAHTIQNLFHSLTGKELIYSKP